MTALTLYLNQTASGTASTADQMLENASTGGSLSNKNTNLTSSTTGWITLYAQGNATAQTGVGSQPAMGDNGWIDDSSTLGSGSNHLNSGTWSVALGFETTTTGTFVADFHFRFFQRSSGGTRTLIGEAIASSQTIVSTSYTVLTPSVSASASNTFASTDRLGVDVTVNILTNTTTGNLRMQASSSSTLGNTSAEIVTPGYSSVSTSTRTIPSTLALLQTDTRTIPSVIALLQTNTRTITPTTIALLQTRARTIPATISLGISRAIPTTIALLQTSTRTIPSTLALAFTSTRTISCTFALYLPGVFYASNVTQTISSLILSDQLAPIAGGVETSVTVTMPASGTNTYVELLAQGGTSTGTLALPSPSGLGWSTNTVDGYTFCAGNYWSNWTLAKSGSAMSGATLIVRLSRRTVDGTYYTIAILTLTGQTFSTKTTYLLPAQSTNKPYQFVSDTFYVDVFVYNGGSTAWNSDVFTVYISNSATLGVANDGEIFTPQILQTTPGLTYLCGIPNFQTMNALPVFNQAFNLADALDQRSILTTTGEDAPGSVSTPRGTPVILSDSQQGLLYTGNVQSDEMTKVTVGSNTQIEHAHTDHDNHYWFDKNPNTTNYANWYAGDIVCDFLQKLAAEGVTGQFAIESDYTPTTFGQGTLTNVVATTTNTPFTYAPNTATPPITTNTGDLELTRAGTQFLLTESVTSDFSSGTLTNMSASNNSLSPTTQSAYKVTAELALASTANLPGAGNYFYNSVSNTAGYVPTGEFLDNFAFVKIWSGSQVIGSNDTFNYDLWIASTSPAFLAGVDFVCSDGTELIFQIGNVDSSGTGLFDQNNLSVDPLVDLTNYAKDNWYTRNIALSGLSGKTITSVSVFTTGSTAGYYTVYAKNIYLTSALGSPFFSTSATVTQLSPAQVTTAGNFVSYAVIGQVVSVYLPPLSYRVSPAHSISGVGLVQNSTVSWTASLPTNGPSVSTAISPYIAPSIPPANTAPSFVLLASYDGVTWLPCANNEPLPGLPAGANVSGLSLYLKESFASGSDPSAIPELLQLNITINSAAAQTTTDIVAAYGNATEWNSGTYNGTGLNSNNQLTQLGTYSRNWSSHSTSGQVFTYTAGTGSSTQSASSGAYVMTVTPSGTTFAAAALSRLDFVGTPTNFTVEFDFSTSNASNGAVYGGFIYRGQGLIAPITTTAGGGYVGGVCFNSGYALTFVNSQIILYPFSGGNIFLNAFNNLSNPYYSVTQSMSSNTTYHVKIVVNNNRHTVYWNHATTPVFDIFDNTITSAGGVGFFGWSFSGTSTETFTYNNFTMTPVPQGTWTSSSISLNSLGTCGNTQIVWNEETITGAVGTTAMVLTSVDGQQTWQQCINGTPIPNLPVGTTVSGKSLVIQVLLYSSNSYMPPIITGLYARVCGSYGTVTGTRISPVLNLSPVTYLSSSNAMYNANTPTNTSIAVYTSINAGSTWETVANSGAGAALGYWTPQPSPTQDLFGTNTLSSYTNTSRTGGSAASVLYTTPQSQLSLTGGSSGLYLSNAPTSVGDIEVACCLSQSDTGGLVWHYSNGSNYYELVAFDASSSGGSTNSLQLYKISSNVRTFLGTASIVFTRGTFHITKAIMKGGLIDAYWDGQCLISYLDTSPLASGLAGLRNSGGTSLYYQLWIQPLGVNLSGVGLQTKEVLSTSDPQYMPQLFVLSCAVRGPHITQGQQIYQMHPLTVPFASYYSTEMDQLAQTDGDSFWYVDKYGECLFQSRYARLGAFPLQTITDPANASGFLLFKNADGSALKVTASSDTFRNQQIITNVTTLITPPIEYKVADGAATSWQLGYPVYSAPTIKFGNGQYATVGVQGIDNDRQFYWQPASPTISYDSSLPVLPDGTLFGVQYIGQSTNNLIIDNSSSEATQAVLEGNSGIVAEIESALRATTIGMTTAQATAFANGLLNRNGVSNAVEVLGTTMYAGLKPGTFVPIFCPEMGLWNVQLPLMKVTTTALPAATGLPAYQYLCQASNGSNITSWARVFGIA